MPYLETTVQLQGCIARLRKKTLIAVDTETTGLDWKKDRCLSIGLAGDDKTGYFAFLPKDRTTQKDLRKLLADEKITKVFHNAKFDMHFLREAGYPVGGPVLDTLFMSKLWNETRENHKLKSLAVELVDAGAAETQDKLQDWLAQNKKTWADLESVPRTILAQYGANDPKITYGLFLKLQTLLEDANIPWELVTLESRVLRLAYEMEAKGAVVDMAFLKRYKEQLQKEQDGVYKKIIKAAGKKLPKALAKFNPESGDQVAKVLTALGWKASGSTATGKDSVDKRALEAFDHPVSKLLLEHRRLGTIRGTFVEGIIDRAVKREDGWTIHTNYNTSGARTGRWSSNDPNLQNVDKKSDARKAFIPRKGHDLWLFDFKQIEPVLFAYVSESTRLRQAFAEGLDYHTFNAHLAFNVPMEEVTPEQRQKAKALGLAILYGAGAGKAATMLGVPEAEGRKIVATYFENLPDVKDFQKEMSKAIEKRATKAAEEAGLLEIVDWKSDWRYKGEKLPIKKVPKFGQPGEFWEFVDKNKIQEQGWVKNHFGRKMRLTIGESYMALNRWIQSTAGDLLKTAMVRIYEKTGLVPLLQVHDELGYELPKGDKKTALLIKQAMESTQDLFPEVPIRVDVAIATKNWGEEVEVKL